MSGGSCSGGVPCWRGMLFLAWLLWWRGVSRLPCVVACCFSPDVRGGEPCRADVAFWGGWGPHTPCARQIGPHPPQPTPPSRHGSLRCVWGRRQKCGLPLRLLLGCIVLPAFCLLSGLPVPAFSFSRMSPYSGAGAHGFARARGEPFRQSLLAVCGGRRLTPCPGAA